MPHGRAIRQNCCIFSASVLLDYFFVTMYYYDIIFIFTFFNFEMLQAGAPAPGFPVQAQGREGGSAGSAVPCWPQCLPPPAHILGESSQASCHHSLYHQTSCPQDTSQPWQCRVPGHLVPRPGCETPVPQGSCGPGLQRSLGA